MFLFLAPAVLNHASVSLPESLPFFVSVHPVNWPQWALLIHGNWIPQISSQPVRRFCSGHLCPEWCGKNKSIQPALSSTPKWKAASKVCLISDTLASVDLWQLFYVWPQKLFTGKDLDELKQTAATQFGQVGFLMSPFLFGPEASESQWNLRQQEQKLYSPVAVIVFH